MLSAGYFRIRNALPGPVWMYPVSYISFHTYSIQVNTFWDSTSKTTRENQRENRNEKCYFDNCKLKDTSLQM